MSDENMDTAGPQLPGSRLRDQRERRGLTIAQASSELHLDRRLLTALENDDYASLGAPIFVKGHLRNYARLLGLDAAELIAEYEAGQQPSDPTLVGHRPDGPRMDEHRSQAWVGWFGWVFLLVLGVLLAAWWYYQQEGGADFVMSNLPERIMLPDETADTSTRDTGPFGGPAGTGERDSETVLPGPSTLAAGPADAGIPLGETASPGASRSASQPASRSATSGSSESPVRTGAERVVQEPPVVTSRPAAPVGGRGLALEFSQESWVEIYDAEGRPILYDLLGPDTRREINAVGQLRVFLGNADGVEIFIGGERFNFERYRRSDSTARFTVTVPAAD